MCSSFEMKYQWNPINAPRSKSPHTYADYFYFALVRESHVTMTSKSSWSRSDVFLRKLQEQQNSDHAPFTKMDK